MDNRNEIKSVHNEVLAFINSRDTETAANELTELENEFNTQLSVYVERIAALVNDPRYRVLLPLAKGGVVIAYSAHDHTSIRGTFGVAPGIGTCMKSLTEACEEAGISKLLSDYEAARQAEATEAETTEEVEAASE